MTAFRIAIPVIANVTAAIVIMNMVECGVFRVSRMVSRVMPLITTARPDIPMPTCRITEAGRRRLLFQRMETADRRIMPSTI